MQKLESNVVLSPTDLANHLACKHLSWLNYHSLYGGARPSKNDDELTEILQQYGAEHEATYFAALSEQLAAVNRTIVNLDIDRDKLKYILKKQFFSLRTFSFLKNILYSGILL
jgi:hypothetical protein